MEWRGWTQAEFAEKVGQTQPWVSKRLNDLQPFRVEELDAIANAFMVPVSALLEPGGLAEYERRTGHDRRSQRDRRRKPLREVRASSSDGNGHWHNLVSDRLRLDSSS